jgi:hypothetical protein
MPLKSFKLYGIKDIDYDAVVAKYRQLCTEGIIEYDIESLDMRNPSSLTHTYKKKPRTPLKDDTRIKNKAMYLVHSIAYRQQTSRENNADGATLQASVLQSVIGEDEFELLKALTELGYIQKSSIYEIGKTARRYRIIGEIITEQSSNATIKKYIEKTRTILNDNVAQRLASPNFKKEYGDTFAETYVRNLNKFKITDEAGFEIFAAARIKSNPNTEAYYDYIREGFRNNLRIYSIDDNNRIYHILTSLKRELKKYLNILFSIDCSNSHPLLFNYFIYISKNISISDSYNISSILATIPSSEFLITSPNFHYDTKKLRNALVNNNIGKRKIAGFRDDELLYLWKTINGCFWDDILAEHQDEEMDRAEIKQKMFAEVFYSKTPKIAWKTFAKEFKKQYPNVYELILKWKEPLKHEDTKKILLRRHKVIEVRGRAWMQDESTALPNVMMNLESVIFREILKSLFAKRICAVHIHDAIVVPAIKSTMKLDSEKIQGVMRDVYKRFGLHPTFKVETY